MGFLFLQIACFMERFSILFKSKPTNWITALISIIFLPIIIVFVSALVSENGLEDYEGLLMALDKHRFL